MKKNLPFFLVIVALIFLIIAVFSSGEKKTQSTMLVQNTSQSEEMLEQSEEPLTEEPFSFAGQNAPEKTGEEKVIFGFEENTPYWKIPDWCFEKDEYVGKNIVFSTKYAKEGKSSLELMADFPGKRWTAAYAEVQEYFDWMPYKGISADVFLPADGPFGLKAKIVLTVGKDWKWTEMSRLVKLIPGQWATITASLIPRSTDWRRAQVTDEFRADVRKLGIKIESNMRPIYTGPIYIDNVRLE